MGGTAEKPVRARLKGQLMQSARVRWLFLGLSVWCSSGPTVIEHLQLMLNQRGGFPVLIEDGEFGSSTGASVEHYQQNENLTVDGVVGRQTWTSLLNKWLLQSEPG
jgi:peptidoglycan hydrolase-like protein with peptidoglycan-binding domain